MLCPIFSPKALFEAGKSNDVKYFFKKKHKKFYQRK
jgi:hypothetical protein